MIPQAVSTGTNLGISPRNGNLRGMAGDALPVTDHLQLPGATNSLVVHLRALDNLGLDSGPLKAPYDRLRDIRQVIPDFLDVVDQVDED